MIGNAAAFFLAEHAAFLLDAGDDPFDRDREVVQGYRNGVAAGCRNCGFVDKIGEVGTGEARREPGHLGEINCRVELDLAHMHLEDRQAAV